MACVILQPYINPLTDAMSPKQRNQPTKFERAPALAHLQLRLRNQQNSPVMARSPAVKEMKRSRAV